MGGSWRRERIGTERPTTVVTQLMGYNDMRHAVVLVAGGRSSRRRAPRCGSKIYMNEMAAEEFDFQLELQLKGTVQTFSGWGVHFAILLIGHKKKHHIGKSQPFLLDEIKLCAKIISQIWKQKVKGSPSGKNILIFFNRLVHKQTESRFKPKDWFCLFECTWAQNSIEDHSTIIKRITDFIKSKLNAKGKDRTWPLQHISRHASIDKMQSYSELLSFANMEVRADAFTPQTNFCISY